MKNINTNEDRFMRINQVVQMLSISKSHIWKLLQIGELKSYKISEKITVFKYSQLKAYMDKVVMEGNHNE